MSDSNNPILTRRRVFAGAATASAVAAAATVLPGVQPAEVVAATREAVPQPGDGYQLTEHVKRYYETTRV